MRRGTPLESDEISFDPCLLKTKKYITKYITRNVKIIFGIRNYIITIKFGYFLIKTYEYVYIVN